MRRPSPLALATLTATLLFGAACSDDSSQEDSATTELASATTSAAEAMPTKIISLSPSLTETLFAVGAGDQVIAVDVLSNYPADAPVTDLSGVEPNVEAIAQYGPDLVMVSDDLNNVVIGLQALDIPVMHLPAAVTLDDTFAQIEQIGAATGHVADARRPRRVAATIRLQTAGTAAIAARPAVGRAVVIHIGAAQATVTAFAAIDVAAQGQRRHSTLEDLATDRVTRIDRRTGHRAGGIAARGVAPGAGPTITDRAGGGIPTAGFPTRGVAAPRGAARDITRHTATITAGAVATQPGRPGAGAAVGRRIPTITKAAVAAQTAGAAIRATGVATAAVAAVTTRGFSQHRLATHIQTGLGHCLATVTTTGIAGRGIAAGAT